MAFGRMPLSRMTDMRAALCRIESHILMSVIFQHGVIRQNGIWQNDTQQNDRHEGTARQVECHDVMSVIFLQDGILLNVVELNVAAPMEKQETEPW